MFIIFIQRIAHLRLTGLIRCYQHLQQVLLIVVAQKCGDSNNFSQGIKYMAFMQGWENDEHYA